MFDYAIIATRRVQTTDKAAVAPRAADVFSSQASPSHSSQLPPFVTQGPHTLEKSSATVAAAVGLKFMEFIARKIR